MKLSSSSISVFTACPRKYYYGYVLCRTTIGTAVALSIGSVMHAALEAFWLLGLPAAVEKLIEHGSMLSEQDAAKLAAMISCYNAPVMDYQVESLEQSFEYELSPGVHLVGKIDGILLDSTGKRWVLEHKSTSDDILGFSKYWQRMSVDHQVTNYILGSGADGALYDVLRKPTIRFCGKDKNIDAYQQRCVDLIKAEPDKFYQFRKINKTQEDIDLALDDLHGQARLIKSCYDNESWPRSSGACRGLYGMCKFLDVCTGCANIMDDSTFRDKEAQHEELI